MSHRISTIVYATLTLLAVAVAATAKGYADTLGEFFFVVMVSSLGLFVAHFWSAVLGRRLGGSEVDRAWLRHEFADSSAMVLPGVLMAVLAAVLSPVMDFEWALTVAMGAVVALLFAYTWLGARRVGGSSLWAVGTAGIGVLMVIFKVVA